MSALTLRDALKQIEQLGGRTTADLASGVLSIDRQWVELQTVTASLLSIYEKAGSPLFERTLTTLEKLQDKFLADLSGTIRLILIDRHGAALGREIYTTLQRTIEDERERYNVKIEEAFALGSLLGAMMNGGFHGRS